LPQAAMGASATATTRRRAANAVVMGAPRASSSDAANP
jgi:hypothetical protein